MFLTRVLVPRLIAVALLTTALACGGTSVPEVPKVEAESETNLPDAEGTESVTHPPPAALPEIITKRPSETARWLDGTWNWQQGTWVWQRGGWIELQDGVRLRPSRFWYGEDGVLYFAAREWRDENNAVIDAPEIISPAATPPTPMLAEEATVP